MPTVLVTRPEPDATVLSTALADIGIDTLQAPLLEIHFAVGPELDLSGFQAVLLTSANGVRALAARTAVRDIPAFAVGDATARAAVAAGFGAVESAAGDVDTLAEWVIGACRPEAGPLFHAAGTVSAGDLAGQLRAAGFEVTREKLYDAVPATTLPDAVQNALRDGGVDGVMVYSPRTARTLESVLVTSGLDGCVPALTLFALSDNVSQAAALPWARRIVATAPDQQSLLDAVQSCYY